MHRDAFFSPCWSEWMCQEKLKCPLIRRDLGNCPFEGWVHRSSTLISVFSGYECLRLKLQNPSALAWNWTGSPPSFSHRTDGQEKSSYPNSCGHRVLAWIHRSRCTCSCQVCWCSREHSRRCSRSRTRLCLRKEIIRLLFDLRMATFAYWYGAKGIIKEGWGQYRVSN